MAVKLNLLQLTITWIQFATHATKVGHVYLKASNLSEKHSKPKRILMVSSIKPVYQSNRNSLGTQISHIKAFFKAINLPPKWNGKLNKKLIQLLHRLHKQRNPVLTYQYITKTIKE